jgi:hypothetical protein
MKQRGELFHVVAEPSRELDLFELDVLAKFHEANIPITFVDRSWLYEFRSSLADGDRYYIDADLVELYGPHKTARPELPSLARAAGTRQFRSDDFRDGGGEEALGCPQKTVHRRTGVVIR